jgi:DNA-binding Xre family transcriptional regulator
MTLLKNIGIAEINIDEFKNGVVNIISSTILSKIGLG